MEGEEFFINLVYGGTSGGIDRYIGMWLWGCGFAMRCGMKQWMVYGFAAE